MRLFPHGRRDAPNTDRRTERIDVHELVPHDEEPILILDEFAEGMGFDSRLDAGGLFLRVRLAAEVVNVLSVFHNGLIAAASQRHIDGLARKVIALRVGAAAVTDADGKRDTHLVADVHGLNLFQDIKLGFVELHEIAPLDHEEILVFLEFLHDGLHAVKVADNLPVYHGREQRPTHIVDALHGLLVVVEVQKSGRESPALLLLAKFKECGLIVEI